MALEGEKFVIPGITANSDLSANQYKVVKMVADFKADLCSAATDCPVGILDNAPKANTEAQVVWKGIMKAKYNATVTAGQRLGVDATGQLVPYTEGTNTTNYIIAQALEGGSAGDIRTVLLCGTPHRAS